MVWSPFQLRSQAEDTITDLPSLRSAAEKVAANILQGSHAQRKSGGHEKFWQFREYQDTDRPQDIDWRQSAKTEHVYVREKELQTPQTAVFWCNRSKSMDFKSERALFSKLEASQVLSLALGLLFQRSDEQVGFLGEPQPGRSDLAVEKLGQRLLETSSDALPEGKIARQSHAMFCGDFLTPMDAFETALSAFTAQSQNGLIVQVLDPAELELPYSGHVVFEGINVKRQKIDNVSDIREAYQNRVKDHCADLRAFCEDHGWQYHLHRTDVPIETTLLDIWARYEEQSI